MSLFSRGKWKCFFCHLLIIIMCITVFFFSYVNCDKKSDNTEKRKKKSVVDYTDADLERLYEQWEENDEDKLEPDELPEWKREQPRVNLEDMKGASAEQLLQASKKGQTLMMFATVAGNPTEKETEQITQRWQTDLFNANYEIQRYVVGENRVLFQLKDGSKAWQIKDYLVQQDNCEVVTIENKDYPGRGSKQQESKEEKNGGKKKTPASKKKTEL